MADDVTSRLLDVARSADALARRFALAERRSAVAHTGLDATATVTVHTRPDGRIEAVIVDADWRSALADSDLPAAVLDAVEAAAAARLETFEAALADIDRAGPSVAPQPPTVPPAPTIADDRLPAVRASMSDLVRDLPAIVAARHRGRSRAGNVTAVVSGSGALVEVAYDPRWLPRARALSIGLETTEAVHAAGKVAAAHSVQRRVAASPLGDRSAFADDAVGGRREER